MTWARYAFFAVGDRRGWGESGRDSGQNPPAFDMKRAGKKSTGAWKGKMQEKLKACVSSLVHCRSEEMRRSVLAGDPDTLWQRLQPYFEDDNQFKELLTKTDFHEWDAHIDLFYKAREVIYERFNELLRTAFYGSRLSELETNVTVFIRLSDGTIMKLRFPVDSTKDVLWDPCRKTRMDLRAFVVWVVLPYLEKTNTSLLQTNGKIRVFNKLEQRWEERFPLKEDTVGEIECIRLPLCIKRVPHTYVQGLDRAFYPRFRLPYKIKCLIMPAVCKCELDGLPVQYVFLPRILMNGNKFTFSGCCELQHVRLPETEGTPTNPSRAMFKKCINLKYVDLPSDTTSIPPKCFEGCISLSEIGLPEGITEIGDSAFCGCTSLSGPFALPLSLVTIGARAFYRCKALDKIRLGENVDRIEGEAFDECPNLTIFMCVTSPLDTKGGIHEFGLFRCRFYHIDSYTVVRYGTYVESPASV